MRSLKTFLFAVLVTVAAIGNALAIPTVTITSPTANKNFGAPASITLTATATPSSGTTITKVEFFRGGSTLIGTVTSPPYTFAWNNVAIGNYSLTAKATDNANGTKVSSAVAITVKVNVVPSVSITAPTNNSTIGSPANITINATASDTDGTVTQVQFKSGSTVISTDMTSPYSATYAPAPGPYSLTAVATDNSGGTKISTTVAITVLAPPTVTQTSPANNANFSAGSTIPLAATASVSGASITKVEFYNGSTLIGTDTSPPSPFTFNWTNVPAGTYALTAKAYDNKGGFKVSSPPVNVTVTLPHQPPTVSITAPSSGSVSQAPASITITANAIADTGSSITHVDFFNGNTQIGSVNTPPYTISWPNIGAGGYLLKAKAFDSTGASTTSSLVYAIVDGADSCDTSPPLSAAEKSTMLAAYGNLPLAFEENAGQTNARVKYLSRGPGYQLFLTQASSTLALRSSEGHQAAVRMSFDGGNAQAAIAGLEKQPSTTNYLVGGDPSKWRSNVSNFAKVQLTSVYPGIDAVYHAIQGKLEYDLHVAPRTDPSQIKLAFAGVEGLSVNDQGALVLATAAGSISQLKPIAYQDVDGVRREIQASYRILDRNRVGFELGNYDPDHTLIIDPVLVYSTYLSGTDAASGASAIALSRCGEAYVTGWTWATNFPTTSGAFDPAGDPSSRMGFVSKLNQAGTALLYSTYVTGTLFDSGSGDIAQSTDLVTIAVDGTGHAYVAGSSNSTDFPVTPGALFTTPPSNPNAVLAKLNSNGSALMYSTYMDLPSIAGVAVDNSNNAYVAAPRTVRKIAPSGTSTLYTFTVGGPGGVGGNDAASAIAVDSAGNAYVTGVTYSTTINTLPVTPGAFQTSYPATSASSGSGFVAKINPAGTDLVFGTYLGSRGMVRPTSIAIDSSGRVYVGGQSDGQGFSDPIGAAHMFNMDLDQAGNLYAFASRLSANGSQLDYFSWVGGMRCQSGGSNCTAAQTRASSIAVDSSSNAWIAGTTASNRIPLTKPLYANFAASGADNFAIKLDASGVAMAFGTVLNGATVGTPSPHGNIDSNATGIKIDSIGSAYVSGWTNKLDFPTTAGAYQTVPGSNLISNAFVTKINESKDTTTTLAVSPAQGIAGNPVTLTATITGNAPTGNVSFFDGSTSLGASAVSGATAQLVTTQLAGGGHTLSAAYAGDTHNNPSTSTGTSYTVVSPTTPPGITLTGIADGASLSTNLGGVLAGQQVTVTATAAGGNLISSVTVYIGASTILWTPNSPTSTQAVTLPNMAPGLYTVYATAVDNYNNSTSTPIVRFVVNSQGAALPTVSITAPTGGSSFVANTPITLTANATPGGTNSINSVAFYWGSTLIGTAVDFPYTLSWTNAAPGTYSVIAMALDNVNGRRLSAPITITVTSPPPPTVTLTSPPNGASYTTPVTIPLAATATPASGADIIKVEFFDGATLLGTSTVPPYSFSWTNPTGGSHAITAKATDNRGATATTAAANITVTTPPPPTVSLTAPTSGSTFTTPATVAVTASATGVGGATITRVELYANATLIGIGTSTTWNVMVPGTYVLTARAYDSNSTTATSSPVNVTIVGDPNEKVTFIHNDFAGNPIAGTDVNGVVVWKENYTPFGLRQMNAAASSSNHQWFGGKVQDVESGLSYFGTRYYDPMVGRFMGIDSVGFRTDDLHSFNRYSFANSNPYRYTDPDGRFAQVLLRLEFVAVEALATKLGAAAVGSWIGLRLWGVLHNENPNEDGPEASGSKPEGSEGDGRGKEGEIDRGKQNKHIAGTNENKTGGEGKSTWADPSEADKLTEEARKKGEIDRTRSDGSSVIKWNAGRKVGEQGQTQVTVHVQPGGKHHGHPSGPTD